MICFVIYGVNIYASKHKFKSFEKMYDILMIFVDFCWNFAWFFATRIRIRFIEADPNSDPADQNETDPNGSGSETLVLTVSCFVHYVCNVQEKMIISFYFLIV